MSKFNEAQLENVFIELLGKEGIPHLLGNSIERKQNEVLIKADVKSYLKSQYNSDNITNSEIETVIRKLELFSASDLYESNKQIMKLVCNGFQLEREDRSKKDLYIHLIDYSDLDNNFYKIVNQLEIYGYEKRIPDGILYINGLPLVVMEFKSAIRENATLHNAYEQLTIRYKRDIPELFKYNAFCIISDGVNSKMGSFFANYEFYYAWRKILGLDKEVDGINSMYTMIQGLFNKDRLREVIHHFIYFPDSNKHDLKIVCRYPQYYAATKLLENIKLHQKPKGDGKGGTYFGATGCGKSYTMLFLARLLMRSKHFKSPTLVIITDRTDLDDQLSGQFTNAKGFIGDNTVVSVESRKELKDLLQGRKSGGVFLTTIHKFTEDLELLTERNNVICISDEAHRSQINLDHCPMQPMLVLQVHQLMQL
jgi:type I restriction enzyme R subunit